MEMVGNVVVMNFLFIKKSRDKSVSFPQKH